MMQCLWRLWRLWCQVSPEAKVSVKLVANAGIGTIAAGVAKAPGKRYGEHVTMIR